MRVKTLLADPEGRFGWLEGLKERHGEDVEVAFTAFDNKSATMLEDGSMAIPGMASTNDIDRDNEIIEANAYESSLPVFLKDGEGLLLFQHGWSEMPLGRIRSAEIRENGLWIDPIILPTTVGKDAMLCVEAGVLKHFSVGFRVLDDEWDDNNKLRRITDLELLEVSVVNIPANPNAQFDKAADIETTIKSLIKPRNKNSNKRKGQAMPDDKHLEAMRAVEKRLGDWSDTEDTVRSAIGNIDTKQAELIGLIKTVETKAADMNADHIPLLEFKTFRDKIKTDITDLCDDIKAIQAANAVQSRKMPISDWKQMVSFIDKDASIVFLRDDNGLALPSIEQRAWALFGVSVEGDTPEGREINVMKDLHDAVYMLNYYKLSRGLVQYDVRRTREYGWLKTLVERHDPILAKAMYSTGTNLGDEWLPTVFSSQLEDLQRLTVGLEELFTSWDMPSNPATWPIKESGATAYRFSEATVNNPPEAAKTSFGTGNVTFTTSTLGALLPVSAELMEDSIIDMAGEIRSELAYALTKGIDSGIMNGDTTATHADTEAGYTDASIESSWIGLRHDAIDNSISFDTQSASAGVGDGTTAFAAADCRYLRTLMGECGERPEQLVYITSIDVWFLMMSFTQVSTNAQNTNPSTWQTGMLPSLDGIPIRVTSESVQTFGAAGLYDSASTHSIIVLANHRKWKMGSRRGYTLEYDKTIRTQQSDFVLTCRRDFKKMAPAATGAAALGYNIE